MIFDESKESELRIWVNKMPSIPFKPDWKVTIIPPFARALVRFLVAKNGRSVSSRGGDENVTPYWEVYPYGDDLYRCCLSDTESLVEAIERELNSEYGK